MGTPDFAIPSLEALMAAGHDIVAVYTQPPRRAGRGKVETPTPVHRFAQAQRLDVRHPARLRDVADHNAFAALDADLAVVAAYGLILPQPILDAPRLGCINVHASLLPRWRGAAPVQRAILAGDRETGVTIMQMEAGLDTGPMRACVALMIGQRDAGQLTRDLAHIGATCLVDTIAHFGAHPPVPQPTEGITYAPKIDKAESVLDFLVSAPQVERQVRAFSPAPGAHFTFEGERIRVLEAEALIATDAARPGTTIDDRLTIACNPGAVRALRVQRAGRDVMTADAFLRGLPIAAETLLA